MYPLAALVVTGTVVSWGFTMYPLAAIVVTGTVAVLGFGLLIALIITTE